MRLLAARKESVGNHSFIILSFSRERASVKVPPVVGWFAFRTDGNRRRKEEGPREDVVNPTVKSSFCQASLRILKRAATKERIVGEHRNTRGASSPRVPSSCSCVLRNLHRSATLFLRLLFDDAIFSNYARGNRRRGCLKLL